MQRTITKSLSVAMVAILVFGALSLTACGSSNSGVTVRNQGAAQEVDHDVSIEKTTLLDIPEITITADSISFQNDSLKLELTLTNKTDRPISAQSGTLGFAANYINNYMVNDGYMNVDLEPNESATEDVLFNSLEMKMYGISQVAEIGLGITVKNNQRESPVNYDIIDQEVLVIKTDKFESVDMNIDTYPDAINSKSLLDSFKATMIEFDSDAGFDQSGISIKTLGLFKNKDDEVSVLVEIQNSTDSLVGARASDITINGTMAYEGNWTGDAIASGKIAVMDIGLTKLVDAHEDETQNIDLGNISQVGIEFSVKDVSGNTVISPTGLEFNF